MILNPLLITLACFYFPLRPIYAIRAGGPHRGQRGSMQCTSGAGGTRQEAGNLPQHFYGLLPQMWPPAWGIGVQTPVVKGCWGALEGSLDGPQSWCLSPTPSVHPRLREISWMIVTNSFLSDFYIEIFAAVNIQGHMWSRTSSSRQRAQGHEPRTQDTTRSHEAGAELPQLLSFCRTSVAYPARYCTPAGSIPPSHGSTPPPAAATSQLKRPAS